MRENIFGESETKPKENTVFKKIKEYLKAEPETLLVKPQNLGQEYAYYFMQLWLSAICIFPYFLLSFALEDFISHKQFNAVWNGLDYFLEFSIAGFILNFIICKARGITPEIPFFRKFVFRHCQKFFLFPVIALIIIVMIGGGPFALIGLLIFILPLMVMFYGGFYNYKSFIKELERKNKQIL